MTYRGYGVPRPQPPLRQPPSFALSVICDLVAVCLLAALIIAGTAIWLWP